MRLSPRFLSVLILAAVLGYAGGYAGAWLLDRLPEFPSVTFNQPPPAAATGPPATFEPLPIDDRDLSPRASADDWMTLEEHDYLPDPYGQSMVTRDLSILMQQFPEGVTVK